MKRSPGNRGAWVTACRDAFFRFSGRHDMGDLVRGAFPAYVMKAGGFVSSFAFYVVLGRLYGAGDTGLFALATTACLVVSMIAAMGTQQAVVRFVAELSSEGGRTQTRRLVKRVLGLILPGSFLLALLLFVLSPFISTRVFHDPRLCVPLQIVAVAVPLRSVLVTMSAALRGLKRTGQSTVFQAILLPGMNLLVLVGLTLAVGRRYYLPVVALVASVGVSAALSTVLWIRASTRPAAAPGHPPDVTLRCIVGVSLPMLVTACAQYVLEWMDVTMLGVFRVASEVGIYRAATRLAFACNLGVFAVGAIAAPRFAETYRGNDRRKLEHISRGAAALMVWTTAPIVLLIAVLARPLLMLFGGEFTAGSLCLVLLCVAQLPIALCGSVGLLLNMCGQQVAFRNAMLAAAAVNFVLNCVLIPRFGFVGAAAATAVSTVTWNAMASVHAFRTFGFWPGYWPRVLRLPRKGRNRE